MDLGARSLVLHVLAAAAVATVAFSFHYVPRA